MAENEQPGKNAAGDRDVMGSLPSARPARRSARRDAAGTKRAAKPKAAAGRAGGGGGGSRAKARSGGKAGAAAGTGRAPAAAADRQLRSTPPRKVPPAGYATPKAEDPGPSGGELVSTAAKAAGELAQLGVGVGRGVLKGALKRLSGR